MVKDEIIQIEQALLGGLLLNGTVISKDELSPFDFSSQIHGELYDLIFDFYREEKIAELEPEPSQRFILFSGWLSSKGLDKYKSFAPQLALNAVPPSVIPHLASQVKKNSASKKLKEIAKKIVNSELQIEDALKAIKETVSSVEEATQKEGLKKLSISELLNTEPPKINFVVNGLPASTVGMFASPGGLGKSMFVLEILTAVATGKDITEGAIKVSEVGPCLYLCLEDPVKILHRRIRHLSAFLHPEYRRKLEENLSIYVNTDIFELVDANGIINQKNFDELKRIAEGQKLIVVDTLRRVHSADENKAGQMSALLQVFEVIAKEVGAAFLLVHHTGKNTESKSRGSSVLYDNIRYQINLEEIPEKEARNLGIANHKRAVKLVNTKSNYGPLEPDQILYRIDHGVLRLYDATISADF
jgi:replicative DNA helicase